MAAEEYRIRKCIVYFYLEDDSIQVIEPRVENSGVPQGTYVCLCVCVRMVYVCTVICQECIKWSHASRMELTVVLCVLRAGTLVRRHRIPLPPPDDDKFYTVEHFNVDTELTFYSKRFKITVSEGGVMVGVSEGGVGVRSDGGGE